MEVDFESLLIKTTIKKINRNNSNNIFFKLLNKRLIYIIMDYLNIKNICDFRKTSIFIHNTFIDYENKIICEKIFNKEKDSLLKINLKNKNQGFCYICEIPFQYCFNDLTYSIIINNNLINDLEDNKLKIVNNNKIIEVDLNNEFKFIDEHYNITIIDIKDKFEINNYFNLKQNIFEYENDTKETTIYILYYSEDKKINISFGELKETENKTIFIFLNSKNNFPIGSPIFNSKTKNLIGYYKGYNYEKHYNEGQYFRYPLNNFIYENYNTNIIKFNSHHHSERYVIRQIKNFIDNPNEKFTLICDEYSENDSGCIQLWNFIIKIIDECPYKGGKFLFSFNYPKDPFKPPQIKLINKIYHPNFNGDGNDIFYDCNENNQWVRRKHYHPVKINIIMNDFIIFRNISETLEIIYSLIINPSLDEVDIVNKECAERMKNDRDFYNKKAKEWTEEYDSRDIYDEY